MKRKIKRVGIITGAAGGIGSAISKKIVPYIDSLILVDQDDHKIGLLQQQLTKQLSIPIAGYYCDISDSHSVESMLQNAEIEVGSPNILINNAGIGGPFHRIDQVSDEEWFKIINTNLKGVFNLSRALLPKMKKKSYGKIVNIASIQGYLGAALSSTYVASKHGVIGYTRAIAAEWGEYGITCNAVCPGYVDTIMGIQTKDVKNHRKKIIKKTPTARVAHPDEIANLVVHLIKDESSFINGSILTIDGGLSCHLGIT